MTSCALSTFILVLQAERTHCTQGKQLPSLSQSFLKKVSHQFQDVARWSLSAISDLLLIHACLQSSHEMPSYKKRVQQANTLFVSVTTASINGALVCYLAPTSRYVCLLDTHTQSPQMQNYCSRLTSKYGSKNINTAVAKWEVLKPIFYVQKILYIQKIKCTQLSCSKWFSHEKFPYLDSSKSRFCYKHYSADQ